MSIRERIVDAYRKAREPVGRSDAFKEARRAEADEADSKGGAPAEPKNVGDALVSGLRAVGASIVSTLGLGGSILLIGSAVLWVRFDQAGLPATQSLQRVPEEQILIEGVGLLAVPVIVAIVAVLIVFAVDPGGEVTKGSTAAVVALGLGFVAWAGVVLAHGNLSFEAFIALLLVAILLIATSLGVAASSGRRFLPLAAAIFISTVVYTTALNTASEAHQKKIQPGAVLKTLGGDGLYGFYVADTDDAIYLGIVRDGQEPTRGDPVALYTIPRDAETRLLIGPLVPWEEALAEACDLRTQLSADGVANPACGNLRASTAQYVALGDSYSSGEGAAPYDLGTRCHRSRSGWPSIVAASADDITFSESVNLACSGAKVDDLSAVFKGDPPQLERLAGENDLVTISIGGNDAGFSKVLRECFLGECSDNQSLEDARTTIVETLQAELESLYDDIAERVGDPSEVIVVGYPRLLPKQSGVERCRWLSEAERLSLNRLASALERAVSDAAAAAGVSHVDVTEALDGHELCTESPWINALTANPDPGNTERGHPTKPGQAAIAAIVTAHLNDSSG